MDGPHGGACLDKLHEAIAGLKAELPEADPARLMDEVGDMLFVLANLARKLNLDPEACLRHANQKFSRRFNAMEHAFETEGKSLTGMKLDAMEAGWQRVKATEGTGDDRT